MPTSQLAARSHTADSDSTVEGLWLALQASGSRADRDRLVLHYTGLVGYVASRIGMSGSGAMDQSDLLQSGVIGLMDAVERFDPERGLKFETYAVTRIRGAMLDAMRAQDWVPRSLRKQARDLDAAAEACTARTGRTPTTAELAGELGVSPHELGTTRAFASRMRVESLDVVRSREATEGHALAESLADPFAELPGDALDRDADRGSLWAAVEALPERDRAIIVHSYVDGLTLAQIGRLLGVTESRVSQLRTKALRRLAADLEPVLAG